jgi:hypothetical protein
LRFAVLSFVSVLEDAEIRIVARRGDKIVIESSDDGAPRFVSVRAV